MPSSATSNAAPTNGSSASAASKDDNFVESTFNFSMVDAASSFILWGLEAKTIEDDQAESLFDAAEKELNMQIATNQLRYPKDQLNALKDRVRALHPDYSERYLRAEQKGCSDEVLLRLALRAIRLASSRDEVLRDLWEKDKNQKELNEARDWYEKKLTEFGIIKQEEK